MKFTVAEGAPQKGYIFMKYYFPRQWRILGLARGWGEGVGSRMLEVFPISGPS